MERSKDWMDQAGRELEHAQKDIDTGFYEWACFSAQQAAEKAMGARLGDIRSPIGLRNFRSDSVFQKN